VGSATKLLFVAVADKPAPTEAVITSSICSTWEYVGLFSVASSYTVRLTEFILPLLLVYEMVVVPGV